MLKEQKKASFPFWLLLPKLWQQHTKLQTVNSNLLCLHRIILFIMRARERNFPVSILPQISQSGKKHSSVDPAAEEIIALRKGVQ